VYQFILLNVVCISLTDACFWHCESELTEQREFSIKFEELEGQQQI
jgi:hypothetical protein